MNFINTFISNLRSPRRLASVALGAALACALVVSLTTPSLAVPLYTQPWDLGWNAYASQNDTNGFGNFATTYDNFYLGNNPAPPGQPGSLLATWQIVGPGNETFVGNVNGFPVYNYDVSLGGGYAATTNTQYWISVVPDLGFPPQWGWSSGTGGEGLAYQDFQGNRSALNSDLAFTLLGNGNTFNEMQWTGLYFGPPQQGQITAWTVSLWNDVPAPVPEPGSLLLLGSSVLGAGGLLRKKLLTL